MAYAKDLYRFRRKRDREFGDLFGEPAWDILLDLFVAHAERRQTSVSSLCIAACVPQTTGLRWITKMIDEGILRREADAIDGRRSLIALAPNTIPRVIAVLEAGVGFHQRALRHVES